MSSSKDNSFAQILGRHAAGAGDSGASGGSGSSGSPSRRVRAAAGNDETEESPKKSSDKPASAKKRRKKTKTRKAAAGEGSGRRGGKRSDPDYTHVTVLLHKDLIRRLKMAKVLQERDMSDIVAEALDKELPPE